MSLLQLFLLSAMQCKSQEVLFFFRSPCILMIIWNPQCSMSFVGMLQAVVCYIGSCFNKTKLYIDECNWPNSQIPQCTCCISHNAPCRTEMFTFLFWMVHCGIWNRCIVGFVRLIYCNRYFDILCLIFIIAAYVSSSILSQQYTSDPKETGGLASCPICLHPSWGLSGDLLEL